MGRERRLLVVAHLSAKKRGSLEDQLAAVARALAARGVATTIALSRAPAPSVAALLGDAGADVEVVDFTRPLRAALEVARLARALRPAVAHLHFVRVASPVTAALMATGAQLVVNDHLALRPAQLGARARLRRAVGRTLADRVAARVAVSRYVAATVIAAEEVPPERVRVIENGVRTERYAVGREAARRALGITGPAIACVARMADEKGVDVALRALALLGADGVRPSLLVAGDGPETAACAGLARDLGVAARVHFLGLRDDVERVLAACDQAWVPSRAEAFGLAAAEAMAAGLPVVASRVGGLPEVVDDGRTGIVVPAGDPVSLARAARALLDDPARAAALGAAGRARAVERFGMDRFVAQVLALYEELVPSWRAAAAAARGA